jgi:exopolysaccharide biosynthesis polyprenyl glycosylphosphotransferase
VNAESDFSLDLRVIGATAVPPRLAAREKRALLHLLSLVLDCGSLVAGYVVARLFRQSQWLGAHGHSLLTIGIAIFLMLTIAREVQSVEALESRTVAVRRSLGALAATALALLGLTFFVQAQEVSRLGFTVTFATAAILIVVSKVVLDAIVKKWMKGRATATILLLDGASAAPEPHMDVVDVAAMGLHPHLARPEMMDALSRIIAPYDRVVVACLFEDRAAWATFLKGHDVGGEILLDRDILQGAVAIGAHGKHDTLVLSRGPLDLASRIQKRTFDVLVGGLAAILLAPLMLTVALLIKLESRGPVLFRQIRVGQGNRQFSIYKFRSMRVEALDQDGRRSARRDDDRVTRVGRFIRRTSIDELPQIFNVLKGDMSIVGPRPHALGSLAGDTPFWEVTSHYWVRHALKPGITGLAQVRGLRGATDTPEHLTDRVRADLEYLSNWSLADDILIVLRTLRVIVHKNAY